MMKKRVVVDKLNDITGMMIQGFTFNTGVGGAFRWEENSMPGFEANG